MARFALSRSRVFAALAMPLALLFGARAAQASEAHPNSLAAAKKQAIHKYGKKKAKAAYSNQLNFYCPSVAAHYHCVGWPGYIDSLWAHVDQEIGGGPDQICLNLDNINTNQEMYGWACGPGFWVTGFKDASGNDAYGIPVITHTTAGSRHTVYGTTFYK
jgi:hypothetical protein